MRISDWSSDVCSSDLQVFFAAPLRRQFGHAGLDHRAQLEDMGEIGFRQAGVHAARRDDADIGRARLGGDEGTGALELGSGSGRARVCRYGEIQVVAEYLKQKL